MNFYASKKEIWRCKNAQNAYNLQKYILYTKYDT